MVSVAHTREGTDRGDDEREVGDRAKDKNGVRVYLPVHPITNNLHQKPGDAGDSTSTVNTAEMLQVLDQPEE